MFGGLMFGHLSMKFCAADPDKVRALPCWYQIITESTFMPENKNRARLMLDAKSAWDTM